MPLGQQHHVDWRRDSGQREVAAVIHDDHLEPIARIVERLERAEADGEALETAIGRDDDGEGRQDRHASRAGCPGFTARAATKAPVR